jgi:hypothetical protein
MSTPPASSITVEEETKGREKKGREKPSNTTTHITSFPQHTFHQQQAMEEQKQE